MPRPHRKTKEPVQQPTPAEAASQPANPAAPAPGELDVFDQAIAARQQGQVQPPPDSAAPKEAAAPAAEPYAERGAWQSKLSDPYGRHSISLGDGKLMRLFRHNRFQQNAIIFSAPEGDDPKPPKEATALLLDRHWRWRPEIQEKPWTKQFLSPDDKAAIEQIQAEKGEQAARAERSRRRAAGDRLAEEDFVEVANLIRQKNGLEPVDYNFGRDAGRDY